MDWLSEVDTAIGGEINLVNKAQSQLDEARERLEPLRKRLSGLRAFISGGPGRLPDLLSVMLDLGVEVVACALYWPHSSSQPTLKKLLGRLQNLPEDILVAPSLYEIEEIASQIHPDFWMGGFREQHSCKRHKIPFIPTTVYTASHQCFEGVRNVDRKIEMALDGMILSPPRLEVRRNYERHYQPGRAIPRLWDWWNIKRCVWNRGGNGSNSRSDVLCFWSVNCAIICE